MQTILGAGGAIGRELAKELTHYTDKIRLVSRNPHAVNAGDTLLKADLTREEEVRKAVEGSSVVYITVGFPYQAKYWSEHWPKLIRHSIAACKANGASLVFFDNVYAYDPYYLAGIKEDTPMNPVSKKGMVRAEVFKMIMEEVESGSLKALVARAADFYGPGVKKTSVLTETVIENLSRGKMAYWLGRSDVKHSFTYTPDAGKATALLGNTPDAYNQVWHLPTADKPPTGQQWVEAFAKELNTKPNFMTVPKWMVQAMSIFMPVMKEIAEMMYQYNQEYVFDSSKFEKRFDFTPTPYADGIKEIVARDYSSKKYPDNFRLSNKDVPKSRLILYHAGNYSGHTEGCNMPGTTKGNGTIGGSRAKMQELRTFIKSKGASDVKTIINNKIPEKK